MDGNEGVMEWERCPPRQLTRGPGNFVSCPSKVQVRASNKNKLFHLTDSTAVCTLVAVILMIL